MLRGPRNDRSGVGLFTFQPKKFFCSIDLNKKIEIVFGKKTWRVYEPFGFETVMQRITWITKP